MRTRYKFVCILLAISLIFVCRYRSLIASEDEAPPSKPISPTLHLGDSDDSSSIGSNESFERSHNLSIKSTLARASAAASVVEDASTSPPSLTKARRSSSYKAWEGDSSVSSTVKGSSATSTSGESLEGDRLTEIDTPRPAAPTSSDASAHTITSRTEARSEEHEEEVDLVAIGTHEITTYAAEEEVNDQGEAVAEGGRNQLDPDMIREMLVAGGMKPSKADALTDGKVIEIWKRSKRKSTKEKQRYLRSKEKASGSESASDSDGSMRRSIARVVRSVAGSIRSRRSSRSSTENSGRNTPGHNQAVSSDNGDALSRTSSNTSEGRPRTLWRTMTDFVLGRGRSSSTASSESRISNSSNYDEPGASSPQDTVNTNRDNSPPESAIMVDGTNSPSSKSNESEPFSRQDTSNSNTNSSSHSDLQTTRNNSPGGSTIMGDSRNSTPARGFQYPDESIVTPKTSHQGSQRRRARTDAPPVAGSTEDTVFVGDGLRHFRHSLIGTTLGDSSDRLITHSLPDSPIASRGRSSISKRTEGSRLSKEEEPASKRDEGSGPSDPDRAPGASGENNGDV